MRDIDTIIARAAELIPQLHHEQFTAKHPADDDGIWYFSAPDVDNEVQLESSTGQCPFLIEHDNSDERFDVPSVDAAVDKLLERLGIDNASSFSDTQHSVYAEAFGTPPMFGHTGWHW